MKPESSYATFRKIALLEGSSYLVLLGIAMPMKYLAQLPLAVTIVGSIHGALFLAFIASMYIVYDRHNRSFTWMVRAFLASIIPFGTFYMDPYWKKEEAEAASS